MLASGNTSLIFEKYPNPFNKPWLTGLVQPIILFPLEKNVKRPTSAIIVRQTYPGNIGKSEYDFFNHLSTNDLSKTPQRFKAGNLIHSKPSVLIIDKSDLLNLRIKVFVIGCFVIKSNLTSENDSIYNI